MVSEKIVKDVKGVTILVGDIVWFPVAIASSTHLSPRKIMKIGNTLRVVMMKYDPKTKQYSETDKWGGTSYGTCDRKPTYGNINVPGKCLVDMEYRVELDKIRIQKEIFGSNIDVV